MAPFPLRTLLLPPLLALGLHAGAEPAWADGAEMRWETPEPDARRSGGEVLVAGSLAGEDDPGTDLVLLVDVSESMSRPSGFDLDGDGLVGREGVAALFGGRDPGDDLLSLAQRLAEGVVEGLDPARDRVAIVTFAGPVPILAAERAASHRDARVRAGFEASRSAVRAALASLAAEPRRGRTDLGRGLARALDLLEAAGPERHRALLVLSDGEVTAPGATGDPAAGWAALDARLPRVATLGVALRVLALGRAHGAAAEPLERRVDRIGGAWHAVRHPADLGAMGEGLPLAEAPRVEIRNLTRREDVVDPWIGPTGRFGALVPLDPGWNRLRVRVVHADGRVEDHERRVESRTGPALAHADPWAPLRTQLERRRWLRVEAERLAAARRARFAKEVDVEPLPDVSARPPGSGDPTAPAPGSR